MTRNAPRVSAEGFRDLITRCRVAVWIQEKDAAHVIGEHGSAISLREFASELAGYALSWAWAADEQLFRVATPHPVAIAAYRVAATAQAIAAFDAESGIEGLHGLGPRYINAVLADPDVRAFLRTHGEDWQSAASFNAPGESVEGLRRFAAARSEAFCAGGPVRSPS